MILNSKSIFPSLILTLLIIISGCAPKYGAYFQQTPVENYKSQTKRYVTKNNVEPESKVDLFQAPASTAPRSSDIHDAKAPDLSGQFKAIEPVPYIPHLSKKELKAAKKEIKREIKEQNNRSQIANRKIWIGVVVGVAGILISILASGSVGAIAIIVGIGFIAWGLIEQGHL